MLIHFRCCQLYTAEVLLEDAEGDVGDPCGRVSIEIDEHDCALTVSDMERLRGVKEAGLEDQDEF